MEKPRDHVQLVQSNNVTPSSFACDFDPHDHKIAAKIKTLPLYSRQEFFYDTKFRKREMEAGSGPFTRLF